MAPKFLDAAYFLSLTFSLSLIMFPTHRTLQFLNHMMFFPISVLCIQFLLLENIFLSFTRLTYSNLSGPAFNVSSPDDTPIAVAVSTLPSPPWASLPSSWTGTPSPVSLPNARKYVSLLKDDFQTDGFGYTLRVECAYGFISLSIPGCSLNQCLMDERYKYFHILDSWWAQLCRWILIPWQLSCRADQCYPLSLWLTLHSCVSFSLPCLPSPFPFPFPYHISLGTPSNKSHWHKLSSQDLLLGRQLSAHSNLYPLFHSHTHRLLFSSSVCQSCYYSLGCLFTYLLPASPGLWRNLGRNWILLF